MEFYKDLVFLLFNIFIDHYGYKNLLKYFIFLFVKTKNVGIENWPDN